MVRAKVDPQKSSKMKGNLARQSIGKKIVKNENVNEGSTIMKKKRRFRPGTKALKEIRSLQKSTHLLIAKAPFIRVVREIIQQTTGQSDFRITEAAVEALREASEANMTSYFEDAYLLCLHAKRVTLFPQDFRLLQVLRMNTDPTVLPI